MEVEMSPERRPETGFGSEISPRASATARRGSAVRGPCWVALLRSFAVVVLQQTAELAIAFDVGQRNRGGRSDSAQADRGFPRAIRSDNV